MLPPQAASLTTQSRFQKRAAAKCLRAVAKHGAEPAGAVAACGALRGLAACLEEFDPGVKEEAAWTLGYVACHTPVLAQQARNACRGRIEPCPGSSQGFGLFMLTCAFALALYALPSTRGLV